MNKMKSIFNFFVWLTSILLTFLAFCLLFILFMKFLCWIETDNPISRGSMLIITSLVACLLFRNKLTFVLLVFIAIGSIAYQFTNFYVSGSTFVDFTASLKPWYHSNQKTLMSLPLLTYLFILFLAILPSTWKLYFAKTEKVNELLD
jgi:hypothetical protein